MVLFSTAHEKVLKEKVVPMVCSTLENAWRSYLEEPEPFEIGWLAGVRCRLVGVSRPSCCDSSLSGSFRVWTLGKQLRRAIDEPQGRIVFEEV
jgi:hypothetical protein